MASSVPLPTLGPTGFVGALSSLILAGTQGDMGAAFGTGLSPDLETPQGQLCVSWTDVIQAFQDMFVEFVSLVDPATSSGRYQDAIGRFFLQSRIAASPTITDCICTGGVNVPIPQGALAKTQGGDIYAAVQGGTIGANGTVTLQFQNTVSGPVACPAGYLNELYQAVPGWDTISNPDDGIEGTAVEQPQAFEVRRQAGITKNARGYNSAIRGYVLDPANVPGIVDCYVIDNPTSGNVTIGDVTLTPGELYVGVFGGADTDVAKAIWTKKPPGTPMYGGTTITVEDDVTGYSVPYPTYVISFQRMALWPVTIAVSLSGLATAPANVTALVQAAIATVFAGTDPSGLGPPRAGAALFGSRFYDVVRALGPWANIITIKVGASTSPDACHFTGSIGPTSNVLTVTAVASGTLVDGQTIGGALAGTVITGQTSGAAGGVGVYTVSIPQTLGAAAHSAYLADQDTVTAGIDQFPGSSAADVQVSIS